MAWSWKSLLDLGWLVFLLVLFAYFWRARRQVLKTRDWLKTKGRITVCEWAMQGHQIWPKIEYVYQVGEREFIGEHLFLDTAHNNPNSAYARQVAYQVVSTYKENREIDVYYDPESPSSAVLDTAIPGKLNFILTLLVFFIVLHLVIMGISL